MVYPTRQPLIHFWAPGLFDFKGGIQVCSRFLLQALQRLYPQARYQVFLMHDRPVSVEQTQEFTPGTRFHCSGSLPASLRTAAFATRLITQGVWQRPDLVITTHLNFTRAAQALKQVARVPYWAIAHGFEAWDIQSPSLQQAVLRADRLLAVSHYTRDRLLQSLPLRPEQVAILPNTFAAERFQVGHKPSHLLERYGLRPDQPVILTVNRLAAGETFHSYDQVLAALPQIRQVLPTVHYLIVGQGEDRPRLERLLAEQHLTDCVTLTGFVPDAELADHYNLCDVFAMPSQLEGFGIVFLEAMACGKPCLGGFDGGQEALDYGRLGLLVDPTDIRAIAQTLIQMLRQTYPHPCLYQPQALRQAVIETFGFAQFQQTLGTLLQTSPLANCHENSARDSFGFSPAGWSQSGCLTNGTRPEKSRS